MRVLLLAPFFDNPRYPCYLPSENLGLCYLASYLRVHNIEADILDANMLQLSNTEAAEYTISGEYDLVGLSATFQLLIGDVFEIASLIKKELPKTHVTIGGHFATFTHKAILKSEQSIDSVVRGDGEITFFELAKAIIQNKSFGGIHGLSYRDAVGRIVVNKPRLLLGNLDDLPIPVRDTLNYVRDLDHAWPTQISSSRGCYGNCSFCDIRAFYGRVWRARSATNVVDEIEYLVREFDSRVFRFTDDEFIGPKPKGPVRAMEIAKEIISRKLDVKLMIDARADAVEISLFQLLKDAGVVDCLIGIESGVDRILKLYNKGVSLKKNLIAIEILKAVDISLNLAFIMFDPRMNFTELEQNYRFLVKNNIVTVDSLRSWLWVLHGTPYMDQLKAKKLVIREGIRDISYRFEDPSVEKVYNIISECTKLTSRLDQMIFTITKYKRLDENNMTKLSEKNKELWIDIFETALNSYNGFDYRSVESKVTQIVEMFCVKGRV